MQVEESKPFWVSPEDAARIIEHITHDDCRMVREEME